MRILPWLLTLLGALTIYFGMALPVSLRPGTQTIPPLALLYNHIVPDNATYPAFEERYTHVSQKQFSEQLTLMQQRNYLFLPYELYEAVRLSPKKITAPTATIIFRNGYNDIATTALPILKQYHLPATIMLKPEDLDKPGYLTQAQLTELSQSNIRVIPPNEVLLKDRSMRVEVSGVIQKPQFEDILPTPLYSGKLWALVFAVVGAVVIAISFYNPAKALAIPLVLLPAYVIRFTLFGIPFTLLELVLLCAFVSTIVLYGSKLVLFAKQWTYLLPASLFVLAACVSTYFAVNRTAALGGLKAFVIEPILFSLVLSFWIKREQVSAKFILGAISLGGVGLAAYTLYQYQIGNYYVDYHLDKLTTFFGNPNYLASYLVIGMLSCLFFAAATRQLVAKVAWATGFTIIGASFYLTKSDSANFGVLFAGLLLLGILPIAQRFTNTKAIRAYLIAVIGLGVGIFLFIGSNASVAFLAKHNLPSLISRHDIYDTAGMIISKRPIFGVGLLNFHSVFVTTVSPKAAETDIALAHNTLLDFWTQMGIIGLAAYVWILLRFFNLTTKSANKPTVLIVAALVLAMVLHGMLDSQYHKNDYSIIFWTLIALSTGVIASEERAKQPSGAS